MASEEVLAAAIRHRLNFEQSQDARDALERFAYTVAYALRDATPGFDWEGFLRQCGATRFQELVDQAERIALTGEAPEAEEIGFHRRRAAEELRQRRVFEENQLQGLPATSGRRVLIGRMDPAVREDADTNAYTVMESISTDGPTVEWVVVHSESEHEHSHELVDALAGKVVRVTIEVIGDSTPE